MSKICPKCGTACSDTQAFCQRCGSRLPAAQQPYGQQPPQGQQPPYGQRPPQGQPPYGQRPPQGQQPYGQQRPGGVTVAPSLLTGLKRLFTSTVLQFVGYGIMVLAFIISISSIVKLLSDSRYYYYAPDVEDVIGGMVGGVIFVIIALIVLLIAVIFNIIGVVTVSKENEKFKIGFYALLAYLGLLVISYIILFNSSNATLYSLFSTMSSVAYAVMFVYVCNGIKEVGAKLGFLDFLGSYNGLVITYLISVGLSFIGGLMLNSSPGVAVVMMLLGWICSIVAFFLYMGYLRKAIRAVSGAPVANQYQQPRY